MFIRKLFLLYVAIALLLAACAGSTSGPTSVPTAINVPTAEAIATVATLDLIPADQNNDQAQARLRLAHFVTDGPNVDLLVNGVIAVTGGQPQVNIPAEYINGYVYLVPGTYHVAVVPTGQSLAQAIIGPLDLPLAAGHRYTLAMMGQVIDAGLKGLVLDETEIEMQAGARATDSVRIWVNNLARGALSIKEGGNPAAIQVPYGEAVAAVYPAGNYPFDIRLNVDIPEAFDFYSEYWNAPGSSDLVGFNGFELGTAAGGSPNGADYVAGTPVSALNIIDYMQGFSDKNMTIEGIPISFDILLAAIKTAGLMGVLSGGKPYYILAPTDAAFMKLPSDTRETLLADPQALAKLLSSHIVAGYIPRGSLAKIPGGVLDRTLINLLGSKLVIGDGYTVNGSVLGGPGSTWVMNGSQVRPIEFVYFPEAQ
jgi:hypothetical protein